MSCAQALLFAQVATTSGDKTGSPPSLEKLTAIRQNIGQMPLAVASGVAAGNVVAMKPYVDKFLVASSITERSGPLGNHEYLVPEKVRELADIIHA
jgi:predicted TIM-barrel enzyme